MGLILFSVALWVLHQELKAYHFHDIVQYLRNLPAHKLLTALALSFLSYLVMTGYDILAIKYIIPLFQLGRSPQVQWKYH